MKHTYITFWLSTALLLASIAIQAQTNYFRMIGGIPHLPVVANTAAVGSPVTGAMVFSQADAQALVYNGAAWYGLCDLPDPETTGSATYFRVVGGLPCMAVLSSVSGTGTQSGMVYYAASGAEGLMIFNGSAYVSLADGFTGGTANAKASVLTGGDKLLIMPVLSTAPTGIEAGAVYLDNTAGQFLVYDGTAWLPLVCDCPPQATALLAPNGGETIFDDAGFTSTYAYYDKDNDTEDASVIDWYLAADSTGNNDGSAVFTGSTYNYTYQTADNGKYLRFSVTPEASSGLTPGDVVYSDYTLIYNCPPLLTTTDNISGDYANMNSNDFSFGGGYIYSDKEGDEEGPALQYRWFVSSAVDGGGTTTTAGTAETYTFADAHNGQYLNLAIAPTAATGNALGDETIIYGQLLQNDAPVASALQPPGDDGTGLIGTSQTLAPDYTYSDTENNTEGASIIEWYLATDTTVANNDDALQAMAATYNYTYNVVDEGKFIRYAVTPKAATGYSTGTKVYSPYSEIHNCVPQATALLAPNSGETIFGDAGFTASYAYYDKDNDTEDASIVEWFMAADSTGNNDGSAVFIGSTYNYSYNVNDNGKYLCYTVTPVAATGTTTGDVVKSGYTLIYNCPPQLIVLSVILGDSLNMSSNDFTFGGGYIYSDKEGDEEGAALQYRWFISTGDDGGGTTTTVNTTDTYNFEDAHNGQYLNLGISATAATGNVLGDETIIYGPLLQNEAPVVLALQPPGDDGTRLIGTSQILTPDYTYSDAENNTEGMSSVEWYLATDTTTSGNDDALLATSATYNYTYNVADEGKFIRYAVTPKAATGYSTGTKVYSPYSEIHNCVPQATALLAPNSGETIFGDAGFTASYAYYDKDNDTEDASIVEWFMAADSTGNNDGSAVFTGSTYNYSYNVNDNGKYLCYTVTPVAVTGTTTGDVVKSGYTLIYNCPPLASSLTLSGTVSVGSTLSVGYIYSDKEGDEEVSSTYQWYWATSSTGTKATPIPGATAQSYTLGSDDRWNYIGVSVTPVASSGNSLGDEVAAYTTTAVPGPAVCPSATLTLTHTAGDVAPVTQTITYQLVETDLGTPLLAKQCWLAQDLGASAQASFATDASETATGWFWQFNRKQGYKMDGIFRTPNTYWPENINENSDWTLVNDPCRLLLGSAWRLPTRNEWSNADSNGSWSNYNHTFGSDLKLHAAGFLAETVDWIREPGNFGSYWSSTQYSNNEGYYLFLDSGNAYTNHYVKARGYTVRCLMEN